LISQLINNGYTKSWPSWMAIKHGKLSSQLACQHVKSLKGLVWIYSHPKDSFCEIGQNNIFPSNNSNAPASEPSMKPPTPNVLLVGVLRRQWWFMHYQQFFFLQVSHMVRNVRAQESFQRKIDKSFA